MEYQQVAPVSDFPSVITSFAQRCPGELTVGCNQYIFLFKITRTSFEYALTCLKYIRVREPVRSLNWQGDRLIVADSEEGLSVHCH